MGDLNIRVIDARDLIPADSNGKSDPFVTVEVVEDPLQKKQKTKVHHKTLNPVWNQVFKFRAPTGNSTILLKVWDHDYLKRNDPLGNVQVAVNRLIPKSPNNLWFDLQGVPSGRIHVEITFNPFANATSSTPNSQSYQPALPQPALPQQAGGYNIPQPGPFVPKPSAYPTQQAYSQPSYPTPPSAQQYAPCPSAQPQQAQPYFPPQQSYPQASGYPTQQPNYQAPPSNPSTPRRADVYDPNAPSEEEETPLVRTLSQNGGMASAMVGGNAYGSAAAPPQVSYPPANPAYPPVNSMGVYVPPVQAGGPGDLSRMMQGMNIAKPTGLMQGPPIAKFFVDVRKRANRDYILIMDMSGSMAGGRWRMAKEATMQIAPFACQADPDGITLYLFNHTYKRYPSLTSGPQVQSIFQRETPSGTTDLAGVLKAAFTEHFNGTKPTTILVITDGEPDSQQSVKKEIVKASNSLRRDEDLSISFIQIGDDRSASRFLQQLDDSLQSEGARFDIVDTVPASALGSMSFDQLIQKSIYD